MDLEQLWQHAGSLWLVWLIILLGVVIWWAYRPRNRKRFEEDAQIPFREDNGAKS